MGFYIAILFLTRIPLPQIKLDDEKLQYSTIYFPLVGFVMGILYVGIYRLGLTIWPNHVVCGIVFTASVILTGGIHIDGFADTMDGLLCHGSREMKLVAMKDSCIGSYGALGVAMLILLKYLFLSSISGKFIIPALLNFSVVGRWIITFTLTFFPYIRDNGLGKAFSGAGSKKYFIASSAMALAIIYFTAGLYGLITSSIAYMMCYIFIIYVVKSIGGVTGDTYGAVSELGELVSLIVFSIISFIKG
jgi:adenosylcobinamide-GDP ribazoletransferase